MAIVGKKFPSVSIDAMSEMGDDLKINVFEEAVSKGKKSFIILVSKGFYFCLSNRIARFSSSFT